MSIQNTNTADATETRERDETDGQGWPKRTLSAVTGRDGNGMAVSVAGGTLIAGAAWTAARNRRRAAGAMVVAGVTLLGLALDQRTGDGTSRPADGGRTGSAEPGATGTGSDLVGPSRTDPRGVSDESDVATDPGEGSVTFTTGGDETGEPKPHLDQSDPVDPRYPDEHDPEADDDQVEVSLSETKMTDELGKVAGPDEEQAYPAREGTDPEPMSERAPQRYGEGAVANKGTGDDGETPDGGRATDDEPQDDGAEHDEETT